VQPVESLWSKETFYIHGITDNTVGPEMLRGRWDISYMEQRSFLGIQKQDWFLCNEFGIEIRI
jgi:hypothetical protein